jgi:hypothetical protein
MEYKMFIDVNLFTLHQNIYIANDDGEIEKIVRSTVENMNNTVMGLLEEKNFSEIELSGNQEFVQHVGEKLLAELKLNYSNKNVRMLINGKVFNQ